MALDPERKVRQGEKLLIPASTYNSLIDMLRAYKRDKFKLGGDKPKSTVHPHHTVFIKNFTGLDFNEAFKIVRLSDVVLSLQYDPYAFSKRPVFGGYIPQSINDPIGITTQPAIGTPLTGSSSGLIDSGPLEDIVPAVTGGITVALVNLVNLTDEYCNPTPGTIEYLTSSSVGIARILYWETLDGSSLLESTLPSNVVIAVIDLIRSKASSSVLYKRDNNTDGCVVFDGARAGDPYYDYIINNNTGPTSTGPVTPNRRIIWQDADPYSNRQAGPQLYIPRNTGRVVVEAKISVRALHLHNFGSDPDLALYISMNFDVVNVDENGHLKSITLYYENGDVEYHQYGLDSPGSHNDTDFEGLTPFEPVLRGKVFNVAFHEEYSGDWDLYVNMFTQSKSVKLSLNVQDEPVRLALRVHPQATYNSNTYVGGTTYSDPIVGWQVAMGIVSVVRGTQTYLDMLEVTKIGKCEIGEGSISGGSIGSGITISGSPRSSPPPMSPDNGDAPQSFNFSIVAVSGGNGSYSFDWDFDDGSTHGTVINPSHTYTDPGAYHPTVTITDTDGNTSGPLSLTNGNGTGDLIITLSSP